MPVVHPGSGQVKPEHMTHLFGQQLVRKNHSRIKLRGKLDSLEAAVLEVQCIAAEKGDTTLVNDLNEVYGFAQHLLGCEVTGKPVGNILLMGMDSAGLRQASHNIVQGNTLHFKVPSYTMGKVAVALNSLRAQIRETELCAVDVFCPGEKCDRMDMIEGLNRLSSAVYILYCRAAG